MRNVYLILLLTYFAACHSVDTTVAVHRLGTLVIVDSGAIPVKYLPYDEESDYPIYYVGPAKDTIKIHQACEATRPDWSVPHNLRASGTYSDHTLELFVDTTARTCTTLRYNSNDPAVVRDSSIQYASYLLRVRNISDSTTYLGRTYYLYFLHREARTKNGEWIKIGRTMNEYPLCLANDPALFLKGGEMVLAKVKRYKGNWVTDFRLVFGKDDNVVYSNTWRDSIDERTLELAKNR